MPPHVSLVAPDTAAPRPPWNMPERREVEVRGSRIVYWEKGQGRPLVLMHGFSGSATFEWGRVIDDLAKRYRVIAPQCIGFAPSDAPDIAYTTRALVTYLGEFFRALDLKDIVLLGESFGGWLVGSYAVQAPNLILPPIARLVIVGGPIGRFKTPKPDTSGFVHKAVAEEVEALLRDDPTPNHDAIRQKIVEQSGLRTGELSFAALTEMTTPTLLLWGDRDALIPLEIGQAAAVALPHSRLVIFQDIGHIPSVECPAEFVQAVTAFCEE